MRWISTRRGSTGQAMVEFALLGPLFFIALFGIIEGALLVNAQVTLDNATREGARIAALCGQSRIYTYNGVSSATGGCFAPAQKAIDDHMGYLTVVPGTLPTIGVACSTTPGPQTDCPQGGTVTITTTYRYNYFVPFILGISATSFNLTSSGQGVSQQ